MAAPISTDEVNNPKRRPDRGKRKNTAKSGGGVRGFFDKFRGRHALDKDIAAITLHDGRTYDFNVDEVVKMLPIDMAQKDSLFEEFSTSSRQVQEYLIKQIEKVFMDFVHEYIEFKLNQLMVEKMVHGRKIPNIELAAEEATIKDFEAVLDDGFDYDEVMQPFLTRHEQGSIPYDLQQIEEALLADIKRKQNKS